MMIVLVFDTVFVYEDMFLLVKIQICAFFLNIWLD